MIAYLDVPSGISGDIFLGCLLDLGWSVERLRFAIAQMRVDSEEYTIEMRSVMKGPLRATLADVQCSEGHVHRHLGDIEGMINGSDLAAGVKSNAVAVFTRLAEAEAKVHGTTRDKIHFHEVGAMDAIIDIVGVCAGLHDLGIEKLYASPLPLGAGWTKSAHGQIPLPAPATLELLAAAKALTRPAPGPGEWVTPTGAALVCQLATFGQPGMVLEKIGTGAGQKDAPWPNVARLWLGTALPGGEGMVQLETNIDDMNPQLYAAVSEKLFAAGAKDVWFTPIQMKKNRPAVLLSALAPAAQEGALSQIILEETTTLGVRVHELKERHEARREMREVGTTYGTVKVKVKFVEERVSGAMPEYEDCKALAENAKVPVRQGWEAASAAAHAMVEELRGGK